MSMRPFQEPRVAAVYEGYPPKLRRRLLELRALIFEIAASTEGVGTIEETLKWGQPSYVTSQTKSGTTIRIDKRKSPGEYAMYVHCQTTLIEDFRVMFPKTFQFEGNRCIVFSVDRKIPRGPLSRCIAAALTYHQR